MYDYKFRNDELTFRKPKHRLQKYLVRTSVIALVAAAIFGVLQLSAPWTQDAGTNANIIPLALPPYSDSPQGSRPAQSQPTAPDQVDKGVSFT